MIGGTEGESDYLDLPGVPWVTYFTSTGAAIHPDLGPLLSLRFCAAGLGLLLAAASCAPGTPATATPSDALALGAELFTQNCAACHGEVAEGGLGPAPALDGSAHAWHHPDQQLYDFVCRGKPGLTADMPAFSERLSPEEIRAITAYFKSLWPEDLRRTQEETSERVVGEYPSCPDT